MFAKITLVIHSLAEGGAQRVVAQLANHWAEQGIQVAVITLDTAEHDLFSLRDDIQRIGLGVMKNSRSLPQAIFNNYGRVRELRRAIKAAAAPVVVSFTEKMNIVTVLACWGTGQRVTICERIDPRQHQVGTLWSWLRRFLYPRCHSLVVQTESVRLWARDLVPDRPIYVIPNAVPQTQSEDDRADLGRRDGYCIAALGRLAHQKGFDLLLAAYSQIAEKHPNWRLRIWGEGPERGALEQQCRELDLEGRVELPGWTRKPEQALREADLFVLSSRYEGFPNALLEAMATGVACISFDCRSGPAEIIRSEENGILVPPGDVDALARALDRLMTDASLRFQLGSAARRLSQRFNTEKVFKLWEAVLEGAPERTVDELACSTN